MVDYYEKGFGTEVNAQKTYEWLKKAVDQGDIEAQIKLAQCYEKGIGTDKNAKKAFDLYKKSPKRRHPGPMKYSIN